MLVIETGTTSQCDIVASLEDYILENDEVIEVTISSLPPVIVETTTALIQIGNDDGKIRCCTRVSVHRLQNAQLHTCVYVTMCFFYVLFAIE